MGSETSEFRTQLRHLVADRHTPEARALYELLLKYAHRRVNTVAHTCWRRVFSSSELEEIVSDVLMQLMTGSLANFRGETPAELLGYVRTIADRCLWRAARKRRRESQALEGEGAKAVEGWSATLRNPEEAVKLVPDSPLSETDQAYLRGLLQAGSKVEHARRSGVSRAAVTQRVQRIQARISKLSDEDQMAVDAWLKHTARQALHLV